MDAGEDSMLGNKKAEFQRRGQGLEAYMRRASMAGPQTCPYEGEGEGPALLAPPLERLAVRAKLRAKAISRLDYGLDIHLYPFTAIPLSFRESREQVIRSNPVKIRVDNPV
jgi:hypothetical protein